MDLYKNAIIYDINNNKIFEKVKIINNSVSCSNKKVLSDIEKKFNILVKNDNINIKLVTFYISLCDYNNHNDSYYWNYVKNIDINHFPLYKKDEDLGKFLIWYNKNFNNSKTDIYETTQFTKRVKYVFDNKEECLASVKWLQTNPKYKNFVQIFYHAGDMNDIERYGYIYIRSAFNFNINNNISSSLVDNIFNKHPINIWNKFSVDFQSIKNTMFYMMNKMKKGVLVCIKNNKLLVFLPFSKANYRNDYYTELYFDQEDKKLLEKYEKNHENKIKKQLEYNAQKFFRDNNLSMKNINFDRTKWVGNDCFFRYEDFEGDKSLALYQDFFVNLCKNRVLPDSIFMLNIRDHPVLHNKLKDAFVDVVDKELDNKYKFDKYAPILSMGPSVHTSDIPLITQDDWSRVSKKYYPDDCGNSYVNIEHIKVGWGDKKNKCVFRGSATGCFIDETNVRIKAAMLSKQYPNLLDAGITSFNRKIKKNLGKPLAIIKTRLQKASFMNLEEKAKFKYILNLDGHVSAFRLGHELSLGSVVFLPKSDYYLWFSYLLKPFKHYIPIKRDLSDLITQINWCINNDDKCKKIAENARDFYDEYLTEKGIYDYMQKVLSQISFKSLNLETYSMNIAIILVYRNVENNSRLVEKRRYLYWMNKMLYGTCKYDIILVEQNYTDKFNIGKLKNIGFDYLTKKLNKKYDNFIFSDIDMIPNSDLMPYFFKITDSVNGIAKQGTRYEATDSKDNKPFVGGIITCVSKVFEQLNGYPNNFYGWEGEDVNLLLRMYEEKKPLYINKTGRVIDIEENEKFENKDIISKLDELTTKNEREDRVYEKTVSYKNYKKNGLSTLLYDVIEETHYENNYHIIVDPLKEKCMKKYPELYSFKDSTKQEYRDSKKHIHSIKQIHF
jgi:hypothetical protein